jgi:hypothetical protein
MTDDARRKKRPRDPNALAKLVVDIATGETSDTEPDSGKDARAVALGKLGGKKGGTARACALTAEQRSAIARKAAESRWKRKG